MRKDKKNDDVDEAMEARLEAELMTPAYRAKRAEFSSLPPQENMDADESRFLRSKQRIPARRRGGKKIQILRWVKISGAVLAVAGVVTLGWATRNFLRHDARFHLPGSAAIEVEGTQVVTRPEVVRAFATDIGRSVFTIPLEARKAQLEQIPWVHTAAVMRLWPNRLRVAIVERSPIAYMREGNAIRMVDADGVVLAMPTGGMTQSSFPIVTGVESAAASGATADAVTPAEQRAQKMHLYLQFMSALDAGGAKNSQTVSEVNMADSEDIRAVITDGASDVQVHFGDSDFLARYQAFVAHRAEWLRQYPKLASVDMRYGRQVVLKMTSGTGADATGQDTTANLTASDAMTNAAASAGKGTH